MTITELKTLINTLLDVNTSDFSEARKTILLNKAQDEITNIILKNDYNLQYDDLSYGDLPEGFLNLVSGIKSYDVREDENFADLISILKITVLDSNGYEHELNKFKVGDKLLINEDDTGIPRYYRMSSKTVLLYPTPDYSLTSGIKIYFIRKPQPILITDTTKELSIPSTFHHLIALMVCYDYAVSKNLTNKNDFFVKIEKEKIELGIHVIGQEKNLKVVMRSKISDPQ